MSEPRPDREPGSFDRNSPGRGTTPSPRPPPPGTGERENIRWHVGTIAFSCDDWNGVFYPPATKPAEQLAFYARHFGAVEINSTFHAVPPPARVARWAEVTPPAFRFVLKMPKAITHESTLSEALAPMRAFIDLVRGGLGEKLACVVIQYPPTLPGRAWPQVERLLAQLPTNVRYAVEFREATFYRDAVYDGLARLGIAIVNADLAVTPRDPIVTTDFTLVRLIGDHGKYEPENHERVDRTTELEWWRDRLTMHARLRRAFVMIGNDYAGFAVASADRFKRLVGQPVTSTAERMGTLF